MQDGRGICALDLNSAVGWAVEGPDGPAYGVEYFVRQSPKKTGYQGLNFMNWLRRFLVERKPELVIYEQPLPPMRQSQTHTASVTMGFAYVTEIVCASLGIHCVSVSAGTWCKAFTGSGKRDSNTKGRVLNECARRGFEPPDDNAGDAIGILSFTVALYHPLDDARNRAIGNSARVACTA